MADEIELVFDAEVTGEPFAVERIGQNANSAGIDAGCLGPEFDDKADRIAGPQVCGCLPIGAQYVETEYARSRRTFPLRYTSLELVIRGDPGFGGADLIDQLLEHLFGQPIAFRRSGREG